MFLLTTNKIESIITKTISNGGYSIDLNWDKDNFDTGYFVSKDNTEQTISIYKGTEIRNFIFNFTQKNRILLEQKNKVLGLWISDGLLFADVSTLVSDLKTALSIGLINNQIAIFDNETKNDITI